MTSTIPPDALDAAEPSRKEAKAARRREADLGPLDPREQYRVLQATLKAETDFLDLADKKARFALVVMSALNAVVLVLALKEKGVVPTRGPWGLVMQGELGIYGICAVYYIYQAIESLRPRGKGMRGPDAPSREIVPGTSLRMLFHTDIARVSREDYRRLWADVRMDNIITELCDQVHMVSRINVVKYDALGRLYAGLGVMTTMVMMMFVTIAAHSWLT